MSPRSSKPGRRRRLCGAGCPRYREPRRECWGGPLRLVLCDLGNEASRSPASVDQLLVLCLGDSLELIEQVVPLNAHRGDHPLRFLEILRFLHGQPLRRVSRQMRETIGGFQEALGRSGQRTRSLTVAFWRTCPIPPT